MPTDAAGRASVEVTPTGAGGGSTTVNMTLIRPPQSGPESSPQLEIGSGSATITWGAAASPASALPGPVTSTPMPGPAPVAPRDDTPDRTYTPPPGRPELAVTVRRDSPDQVDVGGRVPLNIVVANNGDATAGGIVVGVKFDAGLRHEAQEQPDVFELSYTSMPDLPPGSSQSVPALDFEVVAAGRLCYEVTVTADDGARATARGCVTARPPQPLVQPSLSVTMVGPTRREVGATAQFRAAVTNTGDAAVTNLKIVNRYDAAFQATMAADEWKVIEGGGLEWHVDRLEPGERREFGIECRCITPSNSACSSVTVTADGGVVTADETCVEILQGQPSNTSAGASNLLRPTITVMPSPTRVRRRTRITVTVANTGQQAERQVVLRLRLPPEMTPVADQIQSSVASAVDGLEVRFAPIAEMAPGERRQFVIPVDANGEGAVRIWARVDAAGQTDASTVQSDVIRIGPAAD